MKNGLTNCNCAEGMRNLPRRSIDLIFTDPPYLKEMYQESYGILREGAKRVLKPGGFLITYCPHYHLSEIMGILEKGNCLEYYWLVAQLNGASSIVWSTRVMCAWRPILIYCKPPRKYPESPFADVIKGRRSKRYHAWEQSIYEALYLMNRFVPLGGSVLDPFAGPGTSLLAAKCLGLKWTGFELNRETYTIALKRLEQEPLDLSSYTEGVETE